MNTADTTPITPDPTEPIDWTRFDAMSAEARHTEWRWTIPTRSP